MKPSEFIAAYRNPSPQKELEELRTYFSIKPAGALDDTGEMKTLISEPS